MGTRSAARVVALQQLALTLSLGNSIALFRSLFLKDAFGDAIKPVTDRWLRDLHDMGMDLRQGQITPV